MLGPDAAIRSEHARSTHELAGRRRHPAIPRITVSSESVDLDDGEVTATVRMRRASYDPGWAATVNGRPEPTLMVAPALVAVDVPAGTDPGSDLGPPELREAFRVLNDSGGEESAVLRGP
ncbi:MAG TPA: hypothetical protein VG142_12010 [Trebonia sp.]|nr:hypothetical protein [Trebonia sp.]